MDVSFVLPGYEDVRTALERSPAQSEFALTYGELTYEGASALGEILDLGPDDVFYDLGSGLGRAVLQAHLQWGVGRAAGVGPRSFGRSVLGRVRSSTFVRFVPVGVYTKGVLTELFYYIYQSHVGWLATREALKHSLVYL